MDCKSIKSIFFYYRCHRSRNVTTRFKYPLSFSDPFLKTCWPIASTKKESVIAPFQLPQPLCSINESPLKSLPLRLNNSNILFSSMNRVQINDKFQQISRFSSIIHVLSSSVKILSFSLTLVKKRNFNILVRFEFLESVYFLILSKS